MLVTLASFFFSHPSSKVSLKSQSLYNRRSSDARVTENVTTFFFIYDNAQYVRIFRKPETGERIFEVSYGLSVYTPLLDEIACTHCVYSVQCCTVCMYVKESIAAVALNKLKT